MANYDLHASDRPRRELSSGFAKERNLYFMSSLQVAEKSDKLLPLGELARRIATAKTTNQLRDL